MINTTLVSFISIIYLHIQPLIVSPLPDPRIKRTLITLTLRPYQIVIWSQNTVFSVKRETHSHFLSILIKTRCEVGRPLL